MFCEKCGKQIENYFIKCPYCGNDIKQNSNFRKKSGCGCLTILLSIFFILVICESNIFKVDNKTLESTNNRYLWQEHTSVKLSNTDIEFLDRNNFSLLNGMIYVGYKPILSNQGFELSGIQRVFKIDKTSLISTTQSEFEKFTQSVLEDLYLIDGKGADWGIQIVILVDDCNPLIFTMNSWECAENMTLETRKHSSGWSDWYIANEFVDDYKIKQGTVEDFNALFSSYKEK